MPNGLLSVFSDIAGICTGIAALFISVWTYLHGLNREKNTVTITALQEIRKKYFNTKSLSNIEKLNYLNELEYFATGINLKVYSIKVANKMSGKRLLSQYRNWAKDFIDERRKQSGTETAYCEYEQMIKQLQKKREYQI